MKKLLLTLLVFLAACAVPARPAVQFAATKAQIQDALIAWTATESISSFYDGWRTIGITDSSITFAAEPTFAARLIAVQPATLIVTMSERTGYTIVAMSASIGRDRAPSIEDRALQALDKVFQRVAP